MDNVQCISLSFDCMKIVRKLWDILKTKHVDKDEGGTVINLTFCRFVVGISVGCSDLIIFIIIFIISIFLLGQRGREGGRERNEDDSVLTLYPC